MVGKHGRQFMEVSKEVCRNSGKENEMNDSKQKNIMVPLGVLGFIIGSLIGYLLRPSAFLIGQLSFPAVISRGATLQGMDKLLVPMAQTSFNVMIIGGIIGGTLGVVISYYVAKRKSL